ncbi:hypothetical protein K1719_043926 [Acacia pycnantha]|nr:hypothetical protein K1719_043926 [Acacia pycnantha]
MGEEDEATKTGHHHTLEVQGFNRHEDHEFVENHKVYILKQRLFKNTQSSSIRGKVEMLASFSSLSLGLQTQNTVPKLMLKRSELRRLLALFLKYCVPMEVFYTMSSYTIGKTASIRTMEAVRVHPDDDWPMSRDHWPKVTGQSRYKEEDYFLNSLVADIYFPSDISLWPLYHNRRLAFLDMGFWRCLLRRAKRREGRLRILPYHDFNKAPHGCGLCPPNMCKSAWLSLRRRGCHVPIKSNLLDANPMGHRSREMSEP